MTKRKVLFVIHDLGQGGAEKVLVNLVNNMDHSRFDISVTALFGGGVNEQFLSPLVRYQAVFPREVPGNSKIMKLFSPKLLFRWFVKGKYDVIVSYLEGPAARVVSGCPEEAAELVSWIHVEQHTKKVAAGAFRSYKEAERCYGRFDRIVCVSQYVKDDFEQLFSLERPAVVLYNTVESDKILKQAEEATEEPFLPTEFNLIGVGTLKAVKGFSRMIQITKRLREDGLPVHLYILGKGPELEKLQGQVKQLGLSDCVTFLGYQTNPYKYVSKCDVFVCASRSEGFSTAATEALIVGTPVCTTEVSGMKEMLGDNNEYGIVVENDDEALYRGLHELLTVPGRLEHYREQARLRGKKFNTAETVRAVEDMLMGL